MKPPANARVPYTLTFEWSAVPGAAAYAIQVGEQETLAEPLLVDDTADETVFEVDLPVPGPLWWRVRALDRRGTPGPWSAVRKFDILPPPLAASAFGVSLTQSRLAGGEPGEGLVTLNDPAPPGGATVVLASSDAAKAKVPPRVLFAAGETAASFPVDTAPVGADTDVRISASARSGTRETTLTIASSRPRAQLTSFALVPAILPAGRTAQGTVTLAGPAPATTIVKLASGDSARARVPASVTIPAGASAANFVVQTAHAGGPGSVTVSAALEDVVRSATLNLRGAASMTALAAPAPLLPYDGAFVVHNGPIEFAWADLIGAISYTIEVDDSADFAAPLLASRTVPASRLTITPLPLGAVWWRVRANDASGAPGRWSAPRLLRVR